MVNAQHDHGTGKKGQEQARNQPGKDQVTGPWRTTDLCSRLLQVSGWLWFMRQEHKLVYLQNLRWQFDPSKQEAWRQARCWLLSCALHVCIWRVLGMFPAMPIICSSGAGPRTCRFGLWCSSVVTVLLLKACMDKHICLCMQVRVAYSARKTEL